jgi:predicted lipid-binding transport protein (Tim44 family)
MTGYAAWRWRWRSRNTAEAMGDLPHYFDIILFAMVAAFLVLRLRSVLGRRTGNERRRELLRGPAAASDKVVTLGQQPNPAVTPAPAPAPVPAAAKTVAGGLAQIAAADPGFDATQFLDGARAAFEWILGAFAAGDKTKLRSLLSDEVYKPFAEAVEEREAAGETLETRIAKLSDIDIIEAGVENGAARVTVKLVSQQIHVLRAHDGSVVDGDPQNPVEKTDFWTFSRDTGSSDPNWLLVATGSG